jgi:hypothetical protein
MQRPDPELASAVDSQGNVSNWRRFFKELVNSDLQAKIWFFAVFSGMEVGDSFPRGAPLSMPEA